MSPTASPPMVVRIDEGTVMVWDPVERRCLLRAEFLGVWRTLTPQAQRRIVNALLVATERAS